MLARKILAYKRMESRVSQGNLILEKKHFYIKYYHLLPQIRLKIKNVKKVTNRSENQILKAF